MKKSLLLLATCSALMINAQIVKIPFTGNTNDVSGNSNNATNYGAALTTDRFGTANSAYFFDGSDYMTIPTTMDYVNRTIKIWVYMDAVLTTAQCAFTNDNANLVNGSMGIAQLTTNGDKLRTIAGNNVIDNYLNTDEWHMITIAVKGDSFFCYMDTNFIGARVNNKHKSGDGMAKVVIGASRGANNSFWGGKLDDIGIWDSYMTAQQVRSQYMSDMGITAGIKTPEVFKTPKLNFSVNPNPVIGSDARIQFSNAALINEGITFQIFNSVGKLIYESKVTAPEMYIPKELFVSGIYSVSMSNALETKTISFVYSNQ